MPASAGRRPGSGTAVTGWSPPRHPPASQSGVGHERGEAPCPRLVLRGPILGHLPNPLLDPEAVLRREFSPVASLTQERHERILETVPRPGAAVSFHFSEVDPDDRRETL